MKIEVDRHSVCMGDDVFSHATAYDVSEELSVGDFFTFLKAERYLPIIQGNDVAWELRSGSEELGVLFTKTGEVTHASDLLRNRMDQDKRLVLVYYTTPDEYYKRKENQ